MPPTIYKPYEAWNRPKATTQKSKFETLNEFVIGKGGWLTSVPGKRDVTMECLPGSTLPDDLRGLGHKLTEIRERERILPDARIARVRQFTFRLEEK